MDKKISEEIFGIIKKLMEKYTPPLESTTNSKTKFELWSEKQLKLREENLKKYILLV